MELKKKIEVSYYFDIGRNLIIFEFISKSSLPEKGQFFNRRIALFLMFWAGLWETQFRNN